jgi:signal transduction histidine kinase
MNQNIFILIGTAIMFIMAIFIVLFVAYYQQKQLKLRILQQKEIQELQAEMQRQLLETSLQVQEVEQRRIAKDLHDEVGAILSATKMSLNQLIKKNQNEELNPLAQQTKEFIEESISQVRRISKELVPSTLEEFGLLAALDEFINKIQLASGIEIIVNHEGFEAKDRFDKKIELTIFRIAQELTNNALKHAEASEIVLTLLLENNNLKFTFKDNGKGFDLEKVMNSPKSGLGLRNITSRLSVVNGVHEVKSIIGKGTTTEINIKL